MMKQYHLYVFTQDGCPPCTRLKDHIQTLTDEERAELDFVPLKTATGERTALAEELAVELTPTLVVAHESVQCDYDPDMGYEFCDFEEETVERFVGANNIIEHTVIAVQGNYLDEYLVRLERTWVRSMEVQKELGYVNDYTILVSTAADTPNVWLNVEYPNMGAYQPNEEKWNKVNEILAERYGDDEEELDAIAKGYEEIRKMVDHQIVHKVTYR